VASFQLQQANGQGPEIYANGIPHYPGECQVIELGRFHFTAHRTSPIHREGMIDVIVIMT